MDSDKVERVVWYGFLVFLVVTLVVLSFSHWETPNTNPTGFSCHYESLARVSTTVPICTDTYGGK